MINNLTLKSYFSTHKTTPLNGRYIHYDHLSPLLENLSDTFKVSTAGYSVLKQPIPVITLGHGKKSILMWSQMHGNESTTTKALFDLFHFLDAKSEIATTILSNCTLTIIPMLNPDGAKAYTRLNANGVDLNRDAKNLSQPESVVLRSIFMSVKPDFCFNLHGQRTIFSAGKTPNVATISFLTPAAEESRAINKSRKISMEVIAEMNAMLQNEIPDQVGIYDDSFNNNCVGDVFQSENVPTILFEAGHYANDYDREEVRRFIFQSYIVGLHYIALNDISGEHYQEYLSIPKNEKLFYDVIIRNAIINNERVDIAIQFEEKLLNNKINFIPVVKKIETQYPFYSHYEIDAKNTPVYNTQNQLVNIGDTTAYVLINQEKLMINFFEN